MHVYPQPTAALEKPTTSVRVCCGCSGPRREYHRSQPSRAGGQTQVPDDRISRRRAPCTISYLAVPLGRGPLSSCTLNLDWGRCWCRPTWAPCHLLHTLA